MDCFANQKGGRLSRGVTPHKGGQYVLFEDMRRVASTAPLTRKGAVERDKRERSTEDPREKQSPDLGFDLGRSGRGYRKGNRHLAPGIRSGQNEGRGKRKELEKKKRERMV